MKITLDLIKKHFPNVDESKLVSQKQEKEFEEEMKCVDTFFTLPKFIEEAGLDWMPDYKREAKNNSIQNIVSKDKELMQFSFDNQAVVFTYYDKKEDVYYSLLYDFYKTFNLQVIMVFVSKNEVV